MTYVLGFVLSVFATLIPSLITIAILWWLDRYEREPLWLLVIVLLWGAVPSILMSLIAQVVIDVPLAALLGPTIIHETASASIIAPLTEETFKAMVILAIFLLHRREFDGVMDGILYGALVGFGFSMVEDVFYSMGSLFEGGWADWGMTVGLRVGLYNFNHALFTAATGLGFGLARNVKQTWLKVLLPLLGWAAALVLHGLHNAGAVLAGPTSGISCLLGTAVDWLGVIVMFILIIVATQRERHWFEELASEVEAGVISLDEYQTVTHPALRTSRGWRVLTRYGFGTWYRWNRYLGTIVELAYKKRQKKGAGEGAKTDRYIADLRQRIAYARTQLPQVGV